MEDLSDFKRGQSFGALSVGASATKIHTAGRVQSRFKEHESELQHLPWPA
jgi:hypothetical protein